MNLITQTMKVHYEKIFEKYGANVQGVDWGRAGDEKRLELRYEKMLQIVHVADSGRSCSVLDVGCGYGGLYQYAMKQGYSLEYTGIDICENMIEYAERKYGGGVFVCGDILETNLEQGFDFVICNGILTQKLDISIRDMDLYARQLIQRMWELSKKGIVFNVMKSQVDFMNDNLYYKSPLEMIAYCMTLTNKFVLDSSYPLYEYSIYLYKN